MTAQFPFLDRASEEDCQALLLSTTLPDFMAETQKLLAFHETFDSEFSLSQQFEAKLLSFPPPQNLDDLKAATRFYLRTLGGDKEDGLFIQALVKSADDWVMAFIEHLPHATRNWLVVNDVFAQVWMGRPQMEPDTRQKAWDSLIDIHHRRWIQNSVIPKATLFSLLEQAWNGMKSDREHTPEISSNQFQVVMDLLETQSHDVVSKHIHWVSQVRLATLGEVAAQHKSVREPAYKPKF